MYVNRKRNWMPNRENLPRRWSAQAERMVLVISRGMILIASWFKSASSLPESSGLY
jgi:hypothetical protein